MADLEAGTTSNGVTSARQQYDEAMQVMREDFTRGGQLPASGGVAIAVRADAVDRLVRTIFAAIQTREPGLSAGIALMAVGGYGRRELFPFSDVDLMFLLDNKLPERTVKEAIRTLNQILWDCGLRVSPMTRTLPECERFDAENVEFTLALMDARLVAGDAELAGRLLDKSLPKLLTRERKKMVTRLLDVTRTRHAKYGGTLFHLEPNLKECPGGLRDANVCAWLTRLDEKTGSPTPEFLEALPFLQTVRVFLHLRHGRDDNVLDWQTQDEAAAASLGISRANLDAAYWMRMYFRQARAISRRTEQTLEEAQPPRIVSRLATLAGGRKEAAPVGHVGFELRQGRIVFVKTTGDGRLDPAHDPEVVLALFAVVAATGARLAPETETLLEDALPRLAANLEDGPALWRALAAILTGPFAGRALRGMHALGLLELLIPEFHGIDALVIRDAYHRYTVDEHTFVVIDTLHALGTPRPLSAATGSSGLDTWRARFETILRDLPHPSLLFVAALLHDMGKGHASGGHAQESARMATSVLHRLELDPYEAGLVLGLIGCHLEMSAALRRDVFDSETIRAFAAHVPTPEALRMLTLFTYADIAAVHPDALTPWKAENLWRLQVATADFLDRHVDEERVASASQTQSRELMHRLQALLPGRHAELDAFLAGFPTRYLQTRTPEQIRDHFLRSPSAAANATPHDRLDLRYAPGLSELTLITRDRPMLFASMAAALAAWGMNIVTADAFSNGAGVVVDSFRFTDTFRTLELNEEERVRFIASVHQVLSGEQSAEPLLASRRRGRRKAPMVRVETRIEFDQAASTHSTLVQVVAQDTPGLLRALSLTMAQQGCNVKVALVDTEGETAIDVFYLTRGHDKLNSEEEASLRRTLLEAIERNAS